MNKKTALLIILMLTLASMATLSYNIKPTKALTTSVLLTNLEYPRGLWVKQGNIYLTETNGRNTIYGGKVCLDKYNAASGKITLVNNPNCSDAVVVASDNKIYLTSYDTYVPGESGNVTVVDPETLVESHLLDIEIASEDMFIDSSDNILIIGSSNLGDAESIYMLPSANYTSPTVLKTGLDVTRCISKHEQYTYFSDLFAVLRFNDTDGTIETFFSKSVMSMSFSSNYLYYADYFGNKVGRINLLTKSDEPLVTGLHSPINVRYDEASGSLYFLEAGTNAAEYKDGTLKAIYGVEGPYHGDLILTDNDVLVIEGRFDINGSIVVEENATLILRNALLNFTQIDDWQFNITFRNPVNGTPRLIVENASIETSDYYLDIYFYGNSSAEISELFAPYYVAIYLFETSSALISNSVSEYVGCQQDTILTLSNSSFTEVDGWDNPEITISNCTLETIYAGGSKEFTITNCTIYSDVTCAPWSANFTANGLEPDFFGYWNFLSNCSVAVAPSGQAPNLTLIDTQVYGWNFILHGSSNATFSKCEFEGIYLYQESAALVYSSSISDGIWTFTDSKVHVYNSTTLWLSSFQDSKAWFVNSTCYFYDIYHLAQVYVCWYLDVHVVDSLSQDVPYAHITVTYPNSTTADSKTADEYGWAKLTLTEKLLNITGEYPKGNYTVEANYETHSNDETVNMTENKQITIQLSFIVPEFPSLIVLPLFMMATLLAIIAYKRKRFI